MADAQFNLAVMNATGRGTPKSATKALGWYEKAALQGFTRAQFNMGLMYMAGQGMPKDELRGYAWFIVAAADGDPAAIKNRDYIEKHVKADKKAAAQKLAAEFAAKIKR